MSEIKTVAFLSRKSTFASQELNQLNPTIFRNISVNEELSEQIEKTFDPLLSKV